MSNGTAERAPGQISDRGHALPFALDGQRVVRIGIRLDKVKSGGGLTEVLPTPFAKGCSCKNAKQEAIIP